MASAQTAAPGPFGIADATARTLVNGVARAPRLHSMHPFVAGMRHAYERLPATSRGRAVTDAFAWMKSYVATAAFSTAYAAARQGAKPASLPEDALSVDDQLKKRIEEERAKIEAARRGVTALPEEARARQLAFLKGEEDRLADPVTIKTMRAEIEAQRAENTGPESPLGQWNETYPATVGGFVKRALEGLLESAGRIDLTVPITPIKSPAGAIVGFAAPIDHLLDSWLDVECLLAGRDMVLAARAAAEAWLKELSA